MDRQIIKAMAVAIAIALVGIAILGWQYRQLEKQQLPAIEEKIEQNLVRDILERFLETSADSFLTERAMEQKNQRDFFLVEDHGDYEILKVEKLSEGEYRFFVKIGGYIHVIVLIKISDKYYIDSVEIAG